MSDIVDMASEIEGEHVARGVARATAPIPAGYAGECDDCGHFMLRLVLGRCGFCRDGRLPPDDWEPPQRPDNLPPRTPAMPAKTINLPASEAVAHTAIEERAKQLDCTLGAAAADLILAGAQAITVEGARLTGEHLTVEQLLAELSRRFDAAVTSEQLVEAAQRAASAEARAEAAEETLSQMRAVMDGKRA